MSSAQRKLRRQLKRKYAGADAATVTRAAKAIQVAAEEQTADRIYKKLRKDVQKPAEAYRDGTVYMFALFVAFLRDGGLGKPFGATRLERFVHDFIPYQSELRAGKVTAAAIDDAIKEETGWSMTASTERAYKAMAKKVGKAS